ncbi:hypothetical protein NMG60_11002066 [Bertholletia excelsa]
MTIIEGVEEVNDNPIEQVRLTVPITDNPQDSALTFRTWVLGFISCALLAFVNQFFGYRENQLWISAVSAQIVTLPLGKLMAKALPTTKFRLPFMSNSLSLNPGPFTLKEHVLITIFAGCGASGVYAVSIITILKAFYHRKLNPLAGYLLVQTTQALGYGWAGMFRNILVDSAYMWWPANLVQVSLFRALHEKEKRDKGGLTRLQFFLMVFVSSFAYYLIPGYFFPSVTALSVACWIWKDSITAQQIGSGNNGLGIGAFAIDWSTIAGFLGSPLAYPGHVIVNIAVGFIIVNYIMNPIAYWGINWNDARKFPYFSSTTFDDSGHTYNITRVLNDNSFDINRAAYDGYSKLHLTSFFALAYGMNFAGLSAIFTHVALFHGKEIIQMWKGTKETLNKSLGDVHNRIMKRNYAQVPNWWFYSILVLMFSLALLACEGFNKQLQLPWWGIILACAMALFFTLPIGIITATTNVQPGINVITELVIGYLYPGKPLANVTFKTYGYVSMMQAIGFLQDFKLGHYMKVPPRSMFIIQLAGTFVASTVYFATSWWLLTTVKHICDPSQLPEGSPWTCPGDEVFYNASIIWGVVGPGRMFTKQGLYSVLNWFFLAGFLAPFPVWFLHKKFPDKKWIRLINMPTLISATQSMPPAKSINYTSWAVVGVFFNIYIYRKYKQWWARHTYVMSAALDAGVAFMAIIIYFALQSKDILGPSWWGLENDDHCNLARCPTAPGMKVEGCPEL